MSDEYGDTVVDNIQVARYALRTFAIRDGKPESVAVRGDHWTDGVCVAHCLAHPDHVAPEADCRCGIYGALTVGVLARQYPQFACRIVTVIAAEGKTMLGTVGLRTAAARVVAYWCAEGREDAAICAQQFPGARRFFDAVVMARLYRMS
jgi:hypothetical protein